MNHWRMMLPGGESGFGSLDLGRDRAEALESAEGAGR